MAINKTGNGRGKRKTAEQHRMVKDLMASGVSHEDALRQAGWAPAQARRIANGRSRVASVTSIEELEALGEKILTNPRFAEKLIMGRLMANVTAGEDHGSQSAKLAGNHKSLNMWQPEQATYVQVNLALLDQMEAGILDGIVVKTPAAVSAIDPSEA
jgi:hypothetical protein